MRVGFRAARVSELSTGLVVRSLLILAGSVLISASPEVPEVEGATFRTRVELCDFEPPEAIQRGRANFSLIYRFSVGNRGEPIDPQPVISRYVEPEAVRECIRRWLFQGLESGSELFVFFRWTHGRGWTSVAIVGEEYEAEIELTSDCCSNRGDAD